MPREVETSSHWGTYLVDIDDDGRVIGTRPYSDDPDAAPAIGNVTGAQHARARVARPTLRRRWLENGPGPMTTVAAPATSTSRLTRALGRLETFVVDEMHWTPTAKHADIVLPVATTLERDDIAVGAGDVRLRVSRRAVAPYAEAREEFAIFTELARRLTADFDEGLSAAGWLRKIYEDWRATDASPPAPPFDEFWEAGGVPLPQRPYDDPVFSDFRADPDLHPLQTPSGRI